MPDVPLLGQPFAIKSWVLVLALECQQCEAHALIQMVAGLKVQCPSCGATYEVAGMQWSLQRGQSAKFQIVHGPPLVEPAVQ